MKIVLETFNAKYSPRYWTIFLDKQNPNPVAQKKYRVRNPDSSVLGRSFTTIDRAKAHIEKANPLDFVPQQSHQN